MNTTDQQLLSLLRAALWSCPADASFLGETPDWRTLFSLAEKQAVVGLIYDAVLTLPINLQPDTNLLRTAHLQTVRTAQSHQLLNTTLAEIVSRLRTEGIRAVLLKGQGVARNYPNPLRRGCGDIDLYVGEPEYARTCRLLNEWGMLDGEKTTESTLHLHFTYNGVCVEIHRIASVMYHRRRNRLFRRWSDELLQGGICRAMQTADTQVLLPPVRFDTLYLFYHLYRHFLNGGIGLRQLCDCATYLHAFRHEIDRPALKEDLQRFHLLHPWQVVGNLLVRHLGLPEEEFPFYTPGSERFTNKVMRMLLENGNFGFFTPTRTRRPDGYFAGKLHTLITRHRYLATIFPLCPVDVLGYYREFLAKGIAQLFKDTFTKQTLTGTTP